MIKIGVKKVKSIFTVWIVARALRLSKLFTGDHILDTSSLIFE
jgi:hypothetical protein